MIVYSHTLHQALTPFVKSIDYLDVHIPQMGSGTLSLDLFCSTEPALFVTLNDSKRHTAFSGEDITHYKIFYFGQFVNKQTFLVNNNIRGLQVIFRALGPFYLFGVPQYYFSDTIIDATDMLPEVQELMCRLDDDSVDYKTMANVLERYLLDCLCRSPLRETRRFLLIYDEIIKNRGTKSIRDLCCETGISKTRLEAHFNEKIGVTPKKISRIVRFNSLLNEMKANPEVCWQELAYRYGYYDQSHFIKEFNTFSGLAPSQYASIQSVTHAVHLRVDEH